MASQENIEELVAKMKAAQQYAMTLGTGIGAKEDSIVLSYLRNLVAINPTAVEAGFGSLFEFYLCHSKNFDVAPRLPRGVRRGQPKACWMNGQALAMAHPDKYAYVEGYAISGNGIPLSIHHGWVVDRKTGLALELTWDKPGVEYIGVPIRYDFLTSHHGDGGAIFEFNRGVQRVVTGKDPVEKMVLSLEEWLQLEEE